MHKLTTEEKEEFAAILNDEEGKYFPRALSNLPFVWDRTPPDLRDSELPNYHHRDIILASYSNWAFDWVWAWEGLRRLLETLMERREPIPEILQMWAYALASGSRKPPGQGPGRKANSERNVRILAVFRVLKAHGYTDVAAMKMIADLLETKISCEAVRAAIRKAMNAPPYRKTIQPNCSH